MAVRLIHHWRKEVLHPKIGDGLPMISSDVSQGPSRTEATASDRSHAVFEFVQKVIRPVEVRRNF